MYYVDAPVQAEEPLYYKSGKLVDFLRAWQGTAPTLFGRFEELVIELYERTYVELEVRVKFSADSRVMCATGRHAY
jgi:hypothetical protein